MSVEYVIEALEEGATEVTVTFTQGSVVHTRKVNAVFTEGVYDVALTDQRVSEVARGVAAKIAAGVIKEAILQEQPSEV